jgi:hypothetical protein
MRRARHAVTVATNKHEKALANQRFRALEKQYRVYKQHRTNRELAPLPDAPRTTSKAPDSEPRRAAAPRHETA